MLLAIDTSSYVLSCALAQEDKLISEWTVQRRLTHSEQLIPHIDEMMKVSGVLRKDIKYIAISNGPGSFTGLRIGLASAKMMAYIWDIPLIAVDTLQALAYNLKSAQAFILPLIDAQRNNVYASLYSSFKDLWQVCENKADSIDNIINEAVKHGGPIIATGEAADLYKDKLISAGIQIAPFHMRCCRAGSVASAAFEKIKNKQFENPLQILPNYIRRSEAEVQWEKKHNQK